MGDRPRASQEGRGSTVLSYLAKRVGLVVLAILATRFTPSEVFGQAQFELSGTVHLDEADSATRAHLERVKAYVDDRQWDEAVETLREVMEKQAGKVIAVAPGRYVGVADYCHLLISALPEEALALYRGRVDPLAEKWFHDAVAVRDATKLRQIVDEMYCSSWGDDALWALGEIALERGEYAAARGYWEALIQQPPAIVDGDQYRQATEHGGLDAAEFELLTRRYQRDKAIEPPLYRLVQSPPLDDEESDKLVQIWTKVKLPYTRLAYPRSEFAKADIRARLILVSILEGNLARAKLELAAYEQAYPNAEGTLAGRKANFAKILTAILAAAQNWQPQNQADDWPTFAGNFSRNGLASEIRELVEPAWKDPLPLGQKVSADNVNHRAFSFRRVGEDADGLLSYFPAVSKGNVYWCDHRYVYAFDVATGKPAFEGGDSGPPGAIHDNETVESSPVRPRQALGVPRYTLTVHEDRLYAVMGSQVTSRPVEALDFPAGRLVCLDLAAEGALCWQQSSPEGGWSFESPPVVEGPNVYVAMRRSDVRPQVYIACLDAETGQQRWKTFICSAETPGGGQTDEITHNLLTLNEGMLYLNTNLGAVAAVSAAEGRVKWIRLYARARKVSAEGVDRRANHYYRDLNPCVYSQGLVYAAPSDSEWIFALDASTGQIAWESRLPEDAIHLLGVSHGMLMASGNKLWWMDAAGGKVRAHWPGTSPPGYGRGLIAGRHVLWTSRDTLYWFNLEIPSGTVPTMAHAPLALANVYRAGGGNLIPAPSRLLIATADKLYAFATLGAKRPGTQEN